MKKTVIIMALTTILGSCGGGTATNPLLADFDTPFGVPPFDKVKAEHFVPAFRQSIAEAKREVEEIIANPAEPTFENTIVAMERAGKRLEDVASVFFNLNEAETSERMQKVALEVSPMLTEYGNDIQLNPELFDRVKKVYVQRESLGLSAEDQMLLDKTYKGFIRSGAGLSDEDKEKYRELSTELSNLTVQFGQNTLAATNGFFLHLTDSAELAGLPPVVVETAAEDAAARQLEGWVITMHAPSMIPFMQYSENRSLREKIWRAYNARCVGGENDNTEIIRRITELRMKMANLLGFPTYADYVLDDRMAGSSRRVTEFLDELQSKAMPHARKDYAMINEYARALGLEGELMPWDWNYYTEKYKDEHFNLNDEMTRPYFKLENVEKGIFLLANKLYGLEFRENKNLPVYHPDVKIFEVYDKDNQLVSLFYIDYFPRPTKSGGAWMTSYRSQSIEDGVNIRPVISVVTNFTKPTANTPSLLSFNEATMLLHEFGHALHGMLANTTYASMSGTSVYRDFVELPSQMLENWMPEKEFLDLWALHYETGEPIPQELIDKIVASQQYLSGYANSRQLSFGLSDMAWHSLTEPYTGDVVDFEKQVMQSTRVMPYVEGTAMNPSFTHIFSGGYAAGYYGYKWAEVLDADAFAYFKENGIFNPQIAASFRENILEKGGTEPPMDLYVKFRGQEPSTDAFFERAGLN